MLSVVTPLTPMTEPVLQAPDATTLRQALGRYATGVALVCCRPDGAAPLGLTVNSFAALSLQPALVLWSLRRESTALPAFDAAGHFSVSVLGLAHEGLSQRFSSREPDKFADGAWFDAPETGAPLLADALALFECRTVSRQVIGDHVLYVGEVLGLSQRAGEPLLFQGGGYQRLALPGQGG